MEERLIEAEKAGDSSAPRTTMAMFAADCPVCMSGLHEPSTLLDKLNAMSERHYALVHTCASWNKHHLYSVRCWLVLPAETMVTTVECRLCDVWYPLPRNMFFVHCRDCADEA